MPPSSFFRDTRAAASEPSASDGDSGNASAVASSLAALCLIARLHNVAADPAQLCHSLGWPSGHRPNSTDFLLAARHLGLKATLTRTTPDHLALTPLPALALICDDAGAVHTVVLAQCDGQRVLFQDPTGAVQGGRPVIEPLDVFTQQWTGKLILITSRASLAGALAKFDFSWFIPSLVLENLTLTGTGNVSATGNTVANVITGNAGNNAINGAAGVDTMIGGAGNDSYTVDNAGDVITELSGEGTDSVTSSVTYTLSANVENLTLSGTSGLAGTGNALDNALTGNSGSNTLTGGLATTCSTAAPATTRWWVVPATTPTSSTSPPTS